MTIDFTKTDFSNKILYRVPASHPLKYDLVETTKWPLDNRVFKVFRRWIWPDTQIEAVMEALIEKVSINPNHTSLIPYMKAFKDQVIDKHNQRLFWFQTPIDSQAYEHAYFNLIVENWDTEDGKKTFENLAKKDLNFLMTQYIAFVPSLRCGTHEGYTTSDEYGPETISLPHEVIATKWSATHMPHGVEQALFAAAIDKDDKEQARKVYARVLQLTAALFVRLDSDTSAMGKWGNTKFWSEIAIPLQKERLKFLRDNLSKVHADLPKLEAEVLSALFARAEGNDYIERIFRYLIAPYLSHPTFIPREIQFFKGSSEELLNVFEDVKSFAERYPPLKEYAKNYVIDPRQIFFGDPTNKALFLDLFSVLSEPHAIACHFFRRGVGVWQKEFGNIIAPYIDTLQPLPNPSFLKLITISLLNQELNVPHHVLMESVTFENMLEDIPDDSSVPMNYVDENNLKAFTDLITYLSTRKITITDETGPYILKLAAHLDVKMMFPLIYKWAEWFRSKMTDSSWQLNLNQCHALFAGVAALKLPVIAEQLCQLIISQNLAINQDFDNLLRQHGQQVRRLNLSSRNNLSFETTCQYFSHIEHLTLDAVTLTPHRFEELSKLVGLKRLELHNCTLEKFSHLSLLKNCKSLQVVEGTNIVISSQGDVEVKEYERFLWKELPAFVQRKVSLATFNQGQALLSRLTLKQWVTSAAFARAYGADIFAKT